MDIALTSNSTIQDSPLQSVPLLSEAMYKCGHFHEDEYKLFLDIFDYVQRLTPSPSIIIKLDVKTSIILKRIKERDRQMEKDVEPSELVNEEAKKYVTSFFETVQKEYGLLKSLLNQDLD